MPGDRCILQLRGLHPFYSPKYDLKKHPNYGQTAEADKRRNAFDLSRLVTRRMDRLDLNEQYTVYETEVADEELEDDEELFNYDDIENPQEFM